jgi:sigma-B regulation protein RsbU (phosphoserine phosphatase)
MILPVAILLLGMGFAGFLYARNQLLTQWGEASILKLQRAAHHVDMRLHRPKEMINLFHQSADLPHSQHFQGLIVDKLKALEWVSDVDLKWMNPPDDRSRHRETRHHFHQGKAPGGNPIREGFLMMPFHRGSIVAITPPHFDSSAGRETVSLISELKDDSDHTIGRLEVKIRFDYLMDTVAKTGWWQDHKAFLVNDAGSILASNEPRKRPKFGDTDDLERSTLYSMKSLPFGTVFGKGHPPEEISGFYKLKEAPWILVIKAPGRDILAPIVNFRMYYVVIGGGFAMLIIILIRFVMGHTISAIKDVSLSAQKVAHGDYNVNLPVKTQDEVGELISSFNTMVMQLEERTQMKVSLNLAKEVQQNLLPDISMTFDGLDIAGQSIYCDETGGDYYDFLYFPELGNKRVGVAVGDVAGHGVASALFMTTARALLRCRAVQTGDLSQIVNDVNRLLCLDTDRSGNFMTLFLMLFDLDQKEIRWVRAGHDPAILYDTATDEFHELNGKGIALGVNEQWAFQEYYRKGWDYGQVVLIGTDGIWETENEQGQWFGKERLREILRKNSHASAEKILRTIIESLYTFRQQATQLDDITLVVIKAKSENR